MYSVKKPKCSKYFRMEEIYFKLAKHDMMLHTLT